MKDVTLSNIAEHVKGIYKKISKLEETTRNTDKVIIGILNKLWEHDRRFEILEERTAYLPKLYERVDAFMVEIKENRQERILINNRFRNHELRLEKIESKLTL